MIKKTNDWSKGNFPYNRPVIDSVPKDLILEINRDHVYEGTIELNTGDDFLLEGFVKVEHPHVSVENNRFSGSQVKIKYRADAMGLCINDAVNGRISIFTNIGEFNIGIVVKVIKEVFDYKGSEIKDLNDFAKLAKLDYDAAMRFFTSEDFDSTFLIDNKKAYSLYKGYKQGAMSISALNDFLSKMGFDNDTDIEPDADYKRGLEISAPQSDTAFDLVLKSYGSSRFEIFVESDSNAVRLSKDRLDYKDFIMNSCTYRYEILPAFLHQGMNEFHIRFNYGLKSFVHTIRVNNSKINQIDSGKLKKKRELYVKLVEYFIGFRMNTITKIDWANASYSLLSQLQRFDDCSFLKLYKIHIMIAKNELAAATEALNTFEIEKETDVNIKAYYLYLLAFVKMDSNFTESLTSDLKKYRMENPDLFYILWFLLFLSDEYVDNTNLRYKELRRQHEVSGNNVLLLCEAGIILNKNPELLIGFGNFEVSVCKFLLKYSEISNGLWNEIFYVARKQKKCTIASYNILKEGYSLFSNDMALDALCAYGINGNCSDGEFINIYEKAIISGRKIVGLYEFYLKSLPMNYGKPIPKEAAIYFKYNRDVNNDEKAVLYENIVKFYDKEEIYNDYLSDIEEFTVKSLERMDINDSLIFLYNNILSIPHINVQNVSFLASLSVIKKLTLNTDLKDARIVVSDYRLKEVKVLNEDSEAYCPLVNGITNIGILYNGHVYFNHDAVIVEPVIFNDTLLKLCKEYDVNDSFYYSLFNNKFLNITGSNRLDKNYLIDVNSKAGDYYFANPYSPDIDEFLDNVSEKELNYIARNKLIALLIFYNRTERAYRLLLKYGYNKISADELLPLFLNLKEIYKKDESELDEGFLTELATYIFDKGVRDNIVITFLSDKVDTGMETMLKLWHACKKIGVSTAVLEENIMLFSCFTGKTSDEALDIYESYTKGNINRTTALAFLSLVSYNSFMLGEEIKDKERYCYHTVNYFLNFRNLSGVCKLRTVSFLLEQDKWNEDQLEFLKAACEELLDKGANIFDYEKLRNKVDIAQWFREKRTIIYKGEANCLYYIYFNLQGIEGRKPVEFRNRLTMMEIYPGIYLRNVVVFDKEELEYTIIRYSSSLEKEIECYKDKIAPVHEERKEPGFDNRCELLETVINTEDKKDRKFLLKKMRVLDAIIDEQFNVR